MRGHSKSLWPFMNLLIDFFPLAFFLTGYAYGGIYFALVLLMIAMPIAVLIKYLRTRKLDKMYFWSTILLLLAGSMTLYFRNPLFLYWKPTVFYWVAASAFLVSGFVGEKPLAKRFFGIVDGFDLEEVPPGQWRALNYVWVLFFVAVGLLNIYVAYNYEQATWVKFKVFGLTALTFVFLIGQSFWIVRFMKEED
jgi:intracellular septation protein